MPNYAGKKLIAITFDDGPHGTYTPKTLDILKEKGVHVTFFVQGVNLQSASQKATLKREFDEGHRKSPAIPMIIRILKRFLPNK